MAQVTIAFTVSHTFQMDNVDMGDEAACASQPPQLAAAKGQYDAILAVRTTKRCA
jgi:hypothetical protein